MINLINDQTYNELRADWVFLISFGSFCHISTLGDIFGILLICLSHLRCAWHLGCCCGDDQECRLWC